MSKCKNAYPHLYLLHLNLLAIWAEKNRKEGKTKPVTNLFSAAVVIYTTHLQYISPQRYEKDNELLKDF